MIIRDFLFTIMCILIMFCQFVNGIIIRYRSLKNSKAYTQYTDVAILILAVKETANMLGFIAKYLIPLTIAIDVILLWIKY